MLVSERYTILVVDDSEEDVTTYQRYLVRDRHNSYEIHTAHTAREGLQLCEAHWPDSILLDFFLPDLNGSQFITALQAQTQGRKLPAILVMTGHGNEEIAVDLMKQGAQDYLPKHKITQQSLQFTLQQMLERVQLQHILKERQYCQQILTETALSIHRSLDLSEILNTAVTHSQHYLNCDRVVIYQFGQDWQGAVVAEAVQPQCQSALAVTIADRCFNADRVRSYHHECTRAIDDIHQAGLAECYVSFLARLQVRAMLVVPISIAHYPAAVPELWGFLIAHHCQAPKRWTDNEIDFFNRLSVQLAIGIQQAELIARLNQQLWQREAIERDLKRQTERMQRSLAALAETTALLKQRNQELDSFVAIATDAIIVRDLEHRIRFWNQGAERIYGWHSTEIIGRSAQLLYPDPTAPEPTDAFKTVLLSGEWQGELTKVTNQGRSIIVQSRWTLVRDESHQPKEILSVDTDITEKKQLAAQFLRVQRLESIGTLASGIAHDLNNILTPILSAAQLLPLTLASMDERSRGLLSMLETSAKNGSNLVQQILTFARGTDGTHAPLQIRHLLAEVVRIARQTFPTAIEVSLNLATIDLWMISADATQLQQVLMNLVVNARDAMPNGGTLTIAAENIVLTARDLSLNLDALPGAYVKVSISDTGTGIPSEEIDRIFEPFFTTKELGKGTGLGLSTTLGIVKSHGGFVCVDSKIDLGTEFAIYLPAASAVTDSNSQPPADPTAKRSLPGGDAAASERQSD